MNGSEEEYIVQNSDWSDGRSDGGVDFCRSQTLTIRRPSLDGINFCEPAGSNVTVDFSVQINAATGYNSIEFPRTNAIVTTSTPTPDTCTQWPESLTFEFTTNSCGISNNGQSSYGQGRKVRARRGLRALRGKGSGKGNSNSAIPPAASPVASPDVPTDPVPADIVGDTPNVGPFSCEESSSDIPDGAFVTAYSASDLTSLLFCGYLRKDDHFTIEGVPQDIVIHVYDGGAGGSVIQTISFVTSCSMNLSMGDSFGAVTVAGFVSPDGTAVQG